MDKNQNSRTGSRLYYGDLFYDGENFRVRFADKANGVRRVRTVIAHGMPKMEENIFKRYAEELREGRRIKFYGHPEFDPDGQNDNEAFMFIEYFRFLNPRTEEMEMRGKEEN